MATWATTCFVVEGTVNGLLDSDDEGDKFDYSTKTSRENEKLSWKKTWEGNPVRNPPNYEEQNKHFPVREVSNQGVPEAI
jgi:hypothetical protein